MIHEIEVYADWTNRPLAFRSISETPRVLMGGRRYVCILRKPGNVLPIFGLYYGAIAIGSLKNIYFFEDCGSIDIEE
jgi:hypothetical protein